MYTYCPLPEVIAISWLRGVCTYYRHQISPDCNLHQLVPSTRNIGGRQLLYLHVQQVHVPTLLHLHVQ